MDALTARIPFHDEETMNAAKKRCDDLVKPIGALGTLEEIAIRVSGITGSLFNTLTRRLVIVISSDNGLHEEGVTPVPQQVTLLQTINILNGVAGVSVLARECGCDVRVVDIGINGDIDHPELIRRKIAYGTKNFAKGPAMSREECLRAIQTGFDQACAACDEGYQLIGTGEMGICNTSTSSAVLCALTGRQARDAVDKGAGITDEQFEKKVSVIQRALYINRPDADDPVDALAKVGGFDIAGMVGLYLGAAHKRTPVVIDGFISIVAALCAARLRPECARYMFTSHCSAERGYLLAAGELSIEPILNLHMRLGEGSGTPFAMHIMNAACSALKRMATFSQGGIDQSGLVDIR